MSLLGIDVGTTRIKAVLLNEDAGIEEAVATVPTGWTSPPPSPGWVEMPVDTLVEAVRSAVNQLGSGARSAVGLGITGMAESGAAFDGRGRALSPVIAWNDVRGEDIAARLPDVSLRIGQRMRSVLSVAKLGWLVDRGLGGIERWLGVPELIAFRLTGTAATDPSLAARTGCYDIVARRWMPEVADAIGVSPEVVPPIVVAGNPWGGVADPVAKEWGLRPSIPVTVAGHDHLAAAHASDARSGDVVNSVGTAETVLATVKGTAVPDIGAALERGLAVTLLPGGDGWAVLAGAARAGVILRNTSGALGKDLAELDRLAQDSRLGVDCREWIDARATGEPPAGHPGAVWRGVLEGLSARTADATDRLRAVTGQPSGMVVVGGGAGSAPWLRAKQAALAELGVPVRASRWAQRAAARGAALYAGRTSSARFQPPG